ncbi:hypothetical protein Tco_1009245 [Tanacetum coccineum]
MLAKGGAVAEWYGPYEGSAETKGGVSSEGSGLYGRGGPVSAEFCVGVFVSGLDVKEYTAGVEGGVTLVCLYAGERSR